jgi:hypothetical protein
MSDTIIKTKRSALDKLAVILSGVCMLHCLTLPVLLTAAPITGGFWLEEQTFHLIMLAGILPISLIALTIGCRQHKDLATIVLGVLGLGILAFTAFFGHDLFGVTGERLVTSLGGLILACAHIQNYRICRHNDCQHDH